MKKYDLKPTYENLLNTYIYDSIGRDLDISYFVNILNSIDDSCSIALDGNWGSGKTFFVKQVKMVMDAHNEFINEEKNENILNIINTYSKCKIQDAVKLQSQVCVYYDAWQNDNDEDPILSLVYTIINDVENDFSFSKRSYREVAASIMEIFTGRDWSKIIEGFKKKDTLDSLKQNKNMETLVNDFLNELLVEAGNRLVIFVDELDRCKPSYAVKLLERIKHYFDNPKITFVFSVNINELQHTIRKHYGNDFNGFRYLDRFFDLRISLPQPDLQKFYRSLNFNDNFYTYNIVCSAVIKKYHFELREIAKYLNLCKVAYDVSKKQFYITEEQRAMQFCLIYILPVMIGLKVYDIKKYTDFIEGKDFMPLVDMSDVLSTNFFEDLLLGEETYYEEVYGKTVVTIENKLKDVYNAIFVMDYEGRYYSTNIGKMAFGYKCKNELLKTAGLLSKNTNIATDFEESKNG